MQPPAAANACGKELLKSSDLERFKAAWSGFYDWYQRLTSANNRNRPLTTAKRVLAGKPIKLLTQIQVFKCSPINANSRQRRSGRSNKASHERNRTRNKNSKHEEANGKKADKKPTIAALKAIDDGRELANTTKRVRSCQTISPHTRDMETGKTFGRQENSSTFSL
ncbi:hypothetical protein AtEden1_Chr2g0231301 [Arabidopsis thaliana]